MSSAHRNASSTAIRRSTTKPDVARCGLRGRRAICLGGEGVEGDLDARGLAARRGEVQRLGPGAAGDPLGEHGLPREGVVGPEGVEECAEFRIDAHGLSSRPCS